jgi:hypothetical protein
MYNSIKDDIYNVFNSLEWRSENILVVPEHFTAEINTLPYIRLTIAPSRANMIGYGIEKEITGLMILSIFASSEKGDTAVYDIAEKLDSYFQAKTLSNKTQFQVSYLVVEGIEKDNPKVYRANYFIPFKNYGE